VTINDSVIQRSNLLDLCSTDETCPTDSQAEDSSVQRTNLIPEKDEAGKEEKARKEREEQDRLRRQQEEEARLKKAEEEKLLRKKEEEEEAAKNIEEIKRRAQEEAERKAPPGKPGSSSRKGILVFSLIFGILLMGTVAIFLLSSNGSHDSPQGSQPITVTTSSENTAESTSKTTIKANTAQTSSSQNSDNYTNSIGMEFLKIPTGEFMMGSPSDEKRRLEREGPVHKFTIEKPFYLGTFEVTQEQWREVMDDNPSSFKGDNLPVDSVTWNEAQEFIRKLNQKEGTDKYRLPSEAEWEYACRAGTTTRYSFGDDESILSDYAWNNKNSRSKPHPVGQKKPNPWGLYDMHGNVWEWCQDKFHSSYIGAPSDGSAWESGGGSSRVLRGGCWYYLGTGYLRSAFRDWDNPDYRIFNLGFRVLRTL